MNGSWRFREPVTSCDIRDFPWQQTQPLWHCCGLSPGFPGEGHATPQLEASEHAAPLTSAKAPACLVRRLLPCPPPPRCPRPCQLTLRPCGTRCLAARCPCACCPPCPRVPPFPVPLGDLNPRLDKLLLALTSVRPSQQSQPRPPSEPAPCPGMLPLPVDRCPSCQGKTPGGQAKEWGWQAHGTPWPHSRGHCFAGVVQWVKGRVLATARFLPIVPPLVRHPVSTCRPPPLFPQVPQITVSPGEISSQTSGATSCPRSGPGSSGTPSLVHPLAQPHLCRPPRTARRPHRQQEVQLVRRGVPSEEGLQHLVQGLCGLVVEGLCGGGGGQAAGRPQWVAQRAETCAGPSALASQG